MLKLSISKWKLLVYVVVLIFVILVTNRIYLRLNNNQETGADTGISLKTVRRAESFIGFIARGAQKDILKIALEKSGHSQWLKFKEDLQIITVRADIIPGNDEEYVAAVSLPPQEGMVAVFTRQGDRFVYSGKISSLLPVNGISVFAGGADGGNVLIVEQHHDEMMGAFFNADYRDYFIWEEGRPKRVLGLITGYNAYWNRAWEGKDKKAVWLWLRQKSSVTHDEQAGTVTVESEQSILRSRGYHEKGIPGEDEFEVKHSRAVCNEYTWNAKWGRYILGEYKDKDTGEAVALLEDFRNSISSLIKDKKNDFGKIIDGRGQVRIVPLDQLE